MTLILKNSKNLTCYYSIDIMLISKVSRIYDWIILVVSWFESHKSRTFWPCEENMNVKFSPLQIKWMINYMVYHIFIES